MVELKSKVQIAIKWEIDDVHTMSGIEDHFFRIVQELLSNTLRHAKASNLEVYLKQTFQEISLRVYDDGVGFDTSIEIRQLWPNEHKGARARDGGEP